VWLSSSFRRLINSDSKNAVRRQAEHLIPARLCDHIAQDLRPSEKPGRDTKRTQEHREDTDFRSVPVIAGNIRLSGFPCSDRQMTSDLGVQISVLAGSIPATSKGGSAAYVQVGTPLEVR
jgi:hypothetical protein